MNELELIEYITPRLRQNPDTLIGPGDDCAVVKVGGVLQLLAADQVVSGIHYTPDTPPSKIAKKLLKRNLSDIAAMGGEPFCALLTLAGNISDGQWFMEFFDALQGAAERYGVSISGGDVSSICPECPPDSMVASLSIIGSVEEHKLCLRRNAKPGQLIMTTGCFGNSFSSQHHLDFEPRLREGLFLAGEFTRCMMDVSDGLVLDLQRIARASGVGVELNTATIPLRDGASTADALSDGEDYELVFTVNEELVPELYSCWSFEASLNCIGKITSAHSGLVFDQNGVNLSEKSKTGFKHLSE
ncbi:MAG: thiamine-monophosphate kinase [Victivallales bacterium]|nr:thiamine-monophosphate kinase [Victivallales bacterium]